MKDKNQKNGVYGSKLFADNVPKLRNSHNFDDHKDEAQYLEKEVLEANTPVKNRRIISSLFKEFLLALK